MFYNKVKLCTCFSLDNLKLEDVVLSSTECLHQYAGGKKYLIFTKDEVLQRYPFYAAYKIFAFSSGFSVIYTFLLQDNELESVFDQLICLGYETCVIIPLPTSFYIMIKIGQMCIGKLGCQRRRRIAIVRCLTVLYMTHINIGQVNKTGNWLEKRCWMRSIIRRHGT